MQRLALQSFVATALSLIWFSVCGANPNDVSEFSRYVKNTFSPDNTVINHVVASEEHGFVYVAAQNRLFQLDKFLHSLEVVITGPELDSVDCQPYPRKCAKQREIMNNTNKLLLVDKQNDRLIVCGSIFQGTCKTRSLTNVSQVLYQIPNSTKPLKQADFIACTRDNCSAVGVITQGPTVNNNVLYVATANPVTDIYSKYSTISTHSLHRDPTKENKLFQLAIELKGNEDESAYKADENGKIYKYIYAFETGNEDGFVYFLFNLTTLDKGSLRPAIARICKSDTVYYSYVEMPIACDSSETTHSLYAAHYVPDKSEIDGTLYLAFETASGSSLCSMRKSFLDSLFFDTMEVCYKYKGKNGTKDVAYVLRTSPSNGCANKGNSPFLAESQNLTAEVFQTPEFQLDYYPEYKVPAKQVLCGALYLPSKIGRKVVTQANLIYEKSNVVFTGITSNTVGENITIAFIGTAEGSIIQVDLSTKRAYSTILVGQKLLPDFVWDSSPGQDVPHLFVATKQEVFRIQVAACSKFNTCDSCIRSMDPYCGWCILESRCSTQKECKTAERDKTRWLEPNAAQCIYATFPKPQERTLNGDISTQVYLLPVLANDEHYQCIFNKQYSTVASIVKIKSYTTVTCKAPTATQLPASLSGEDYVNVSLSLRYNSETVIVSTTAMFYDCHTYGKLLRKDSPCNGCLSSRWSCRWCINTHECVAREENVHCKTNKTVCPAVVSISKSDQLISVGESRSITIHAKNLPTEDGTYRCNVTVGNATPINVSAKKIGDRVICNEHKYSYTENVVEATATITVFWKLNFVVDNTQAESIRFYKCSVDHSDCSLCVTADPRYNCGWCSSTRQCTIRSSCPNVVQWIINGTSCPNHEIKSFTPTSGPVNGGTIVQIFGTNMGIKPEDIQSVFVAKEPCAVIKQEYATSVRIVCKTSNSFATTTGRVSVTIRNVTKYSKDEFKYRNPTLTGLTTRKGPQAGGTYVTIEGVDLITGSNISASIGSYPCNVVLNNSTSTSLVCVTSPALKPSQQQVYVRFDTYQPPSRDFFTYTTNPQVKEFSSLSPTLTSFLGGGRNISFVGTTFGSVQRPWLVASPNPGEYVDSERRKRSVKLRDIVSYLRKKLRKRRATSQDVTSRRALPTYHLSQYMSFCTVVNDTFMFCPTPEISSTQGANASANVSQTFVYRSKLVLHMDNLEIQINRSDNTLPLTYYPNPYVMDLKSSDKQYRENTLLTFKVFNLDKRAITKEEIVVKVANQRCIVTTLDGEDMHCTMPAKTVEMPSYPVTVDIGSLRFEPGSVRYFSDPAAADIVLISVIVGAVVVLIVIIAIIFYVKKSKSYKANKNDFQKAMENMEMSVRADFRKAFAELSIDMTDLAGDLGDYGKKSYLDYRTYVTNLFFPSYKYHPCMKEPGPSTNLSPDVEQGLSQFLLLLSQHNFLTVFIHTLEDQNSFTNRDKLNVASLLTVVLHQKLDYFTEIMKSLVSDLIAVNVQRNPKLVLRRSDSVAERMLSNWMYICLYPYLRDNAGSPIFLLLKAIKQQVSKGPLDAITGKVRYTLNDDRLLKEDIEFETLTLFVAPSNSSDDEPVIVKVLSCDSVIQVKEKVMDAVYKRVPFSQRPKPEQLDIEWRHGRGGHLVLPTQDFTTEPGSRWRRLMCIADYKVANNATLALMASQQERHGSQDLSSAVSNHSVDTSPLSPMLPEETAVKTFHLAKYTDDTDAKRESAINRDRHKHIPELYLLRLINMKGILQNYVDGVMQAILDKDSIPIPVRHFFHFLDEIGAQHGITDPEILHMWKTNSFLLRFWVMILKTPEAVFDVEKPDTIASSMAVISQTFIDACSVQEHKPTKDSPINKQLYAKEIPTYKKWVQDYYKVIKEQHPVSDQDVSAYIAEISREHACEFDKNVALRELWSFVSKYFEEINEALENDTGVNVNAAAVIQRLQQIYTLIDTTGNGA